MPNWKKVIVSGSNAILNNITASGDISASGDIYATNFYGNFEGTINSASHATEVLVSGINSFGTFPIVFSNNNALFKDSDSGDFTYDPSSNTLVVDNVLGTASLATTASHATEVLVNELNNSSFYDIVFNNNSVLYKDDTYGEFAYNPSTNTLRASNITGTASLATTASYATFADTISISNDSNNRITTTNGDGTLNAEQNLNFNGSTLELTGSLTVDANNPITIKGQVGNVITIRNEGSTDIIKIGDVDLNNGETLITINDNSNIITLNSDTITLNASNKLDINANIDASNYNITASAISASSFIGNLTGTSTLASNLTGTPSIIVNNITASGNISASGDLYSTHVFIPQGTTTANAGLIFGDTIAGNSGYIADNDGSLVIGYNDSDKLSISDNNEALTLAGNTRITGHITASKNVNVSGDLIVGGNITANQYIVSSSVTHITQSFSSGSTIFGDSVDDTHQFTGNITASGDISASGTGFFNAVRIPQDDGSGTQKLYFGSAPNGDSGYLYDDNSNLQLGYNDTDIITIHDAGTNVSITGNLKTTSHITASLNISASGHISADHLILNPNTTTTGSNNTETQINISLGDEEYKSGVIKRVFNFRDNLPSATTIDINNQVIADVGEFTRATFDFNFELKGLRPSSESPIVSGTGSIHQSIDLSGQTNNEYAIGTATDIIYSNNDILSTMLNIGTNGNVDEGSTGLAFLTNASQPSFLRVESNQLKFNFADPNSIAIYLSGSLTTVYLNYQLYK